MPESAIGGDEYIAFQLLHRHMVFQMLPAELKKGAGAMTLERFHQSRVD